MTDKMFNNQPCTENHYANYSHRDHVTMNDEPMQFLKCKTTGLHIAEGCSIIDTLRRQGIEHQPGPAWHAKDDEKYVVIESINTTALPCCAGIVTNRGAHISFIQEHSMPAYTITGWQKTLAASQYELDAGPLDPECNRTGGVAVLTTNPYHAIPYIPFYENYSKAYDTGRIAAHWIQCDGQSVLCWNLYGWTGAGTTVVDTDKSNEAAQRTDDLVCIMQEETLAQGDVPALCCADVNATTADIPSLHKMIEDETWIDCGAKASLWGGINDQYTCQANKISAQSRIDHIFVNARLFPAVCGFQVDYCDNFHAHQPLQLRLLAGEIRAKVSKARKTLSASKLFEEMVEKEFAAKPEVGEETTRKNVLDRLHMRMSIIL